MICTEWRCTTIDRKTRQYLTNSCCAMSTRLSCLSHKIARPATAPATSPFRRSSLSRYTRMPLLTSFHKSANVPNMPPNRIAFSPLKDAARSCDNGALIKPIINVFRCFLDVTLWCLPPSNNTQEIQAKVDTSSKSISYQESPYIQCDNRKQRRMLLCGSLIY